MTSKTTKRKTRAPKGLFLREAVQFFKRHGIKQPVRYLSQRSGMSVAGIYWLFRAVQLNGVGSSDGQMEPRSACFLIMQADEVLDDDERFEVTPIEKYLRPLLEKFYQENKTDGKSKRK